jgi:hypothetical protein
MLEITSKLFTWNPKTMTFSGEASELDHEMERLGHHRLDYQSGQWGFHMKSHRTGRSLWFRREREHRDSELELTHVEFVAWNPTTSTWLTLMVFND